MVEPSARMDSVGSSGQIAWQFVSRKAERESMGGYIERISGEIADILLREGIDYVQTKAVFKAARTKAGLRASKEKRTAPDRLTLEEQFRFIDTAYASEGQVGLMVQTLLETGTRVSEFVALRTEDVSLGERVIVVENGKGGTWREVPIRAELEGNWIACCPCTSESGDPDRCLSAVRGAQGAHVSIPVSGFDRWSSRSRGRPGSGNAYTPTC